MSIHVSAGDRLVHEGGRDVAYDLSGTNSEFLRSTEYVHYTQSDQVIELPVPAYVMQPTASAITSDRLGTRVYLIQETFENNTAVAEEIELTYKSTIDGERQWTYVEEDSTAMAKAMLLFNDSLNATGVPVEFDGTLARKIKVRLTEGTSVRIKIKYQAFYADLVDTENFAGQRGPVYSRELGQYLLDKLDELNARTTVLTKNMFGNTSATTDILDEDLTAQLDDNYVTYELHEVNTASGKTLLAPAKGSFYPGVKDHKSYFKMYKLYTDVATVDAEMIKGGTRNGWLFIYTQNNVRVYSELITGSFENYQSYYVTDRAGAYVKLLTGVDFTLGDSIETWLTNHQKFQSGQTYYKKDATGAYVALTASTTESATTYIVGNSITAWTKTYSAYVYQKRAGIASYEDHQYLEVPLDVVYVLKTIELTDPRSCFDATVNDTSALITRECRVILTADNVASYKNYRGTFVDIGLQMASSKLLTLGTDYEFCDANLAKTERTYSDQAVYDHVRLLSEITTEENLAVAICYQAFGGQVLPSDVRNIRQDLTNLQSILGQHHLLTVENLVKHPALQEFQSRLNRMEQYHYHFNQVDHQVFKGMSGFHWINIATLYDLTWFTELGDNPIKEVGTFRVSSRDQRWCYEFTVSVDMSKAEAQVLKVRVLGAQSSIQNTLDDFTAFTSKEHLALRFCWNGTGKNSGGVLQLGWNYDAYNYSTDDEWDNDTVTVTNKSGNTSMWRLYANPLEVTKDADASISLYGHVKYIPFQGTTQADVPYYVQLVEYLYYVTGSDSIKSGVSYFYKDSSTGTYYKAEDLVVGTKVADIEETVYEREQYRVVYQRYSVATGTVITYEDGVYVVDTDSSFSDTSFTFINPAETWDHYNNPDYSKCSTAYMVDDDTGTLLWTGNYPLKYFSFGPGKGITPFTLHCALTESDQSVFNAAMLSQAVVMFYDRYRGQYFAKNIELAVDTDDTEGCRGNGFFFFEDMCGISLHLYASDRSKYTYYTTSDTYILSGKTYYVNTGTAAVPVYKPMDSIVKTAGYQAGAAFYIKNDDDEFESISITSASAYTEAKEEYEDVYAVALGYKRTLLETSTLYLVKVNPVYDIDVEVGLGTSSQINDRFDIRQIKVK